MGFWIAVFVMVVVVVGGSIAAGAALNRRGRPPRANPREPMTALKASGALRHRKSNRP